MTEWMWREHLLKIICIFAEKQSKILFSVNVKFMKILYVILIISSQYSQSYSAVSSSSRMNVVEEVPTLDVGKLCFFYTFINISKVVSRQIRFISFDAICVMVNLFGV